jgi:hypothetical protein
MTCVITFTRRGREGGPSWPDRYLLDQLEVSTSESETDVGPLMFPCGRHRVLPIRLRNGRIVEVRSKEPAMYHKSLRSDCVLRMFSSKLALETALPRNEACRQCHRVSAVVAVAPLPPLLAAPNVDIVYSCSTHHLENCTTSVNRLHSNVHEHTSTAQRREL